MSAFGVFYNNKEGTGNAVGGWPDCPLFFIDSLIAGTAMMGMITWPDSPTVTLWLHLDHTARELVRNALTSLC